MNRLTSIIKQAMLDIIEELDNMEDAEYEDSHDDYSGDKMTSQQLFSILSEVGLTSDDANKILKELDNE